MRKAIAVLFFMVFPTLAASDPVDLAKEAIKNQMKDPESTQFRNVRQTVNSLGSQYICGEVNSKNSYGGYVGFKYFAYSDGRLVIDGSYENSNEMEFFSLSGCGGKDLERIAVARKQAMTGCGISWEQIADVILFGVTPEKAADRAVKKIKSMNPNLSTKDEKDMKAKFVDSMRLTLSDDSFVKNVKSNSASTQRSFMYSCVDNTSRALSGR